MTSIERAKKFIQSKGRTIALTLVPLASLAAVSVPAHAGTIGPAISTGLVFNATSCSGGSSGGADNGSACSITQLPPQAGLTGVTLSGTGGVTNTTSSGGFGEVFFFGAGTTNSGSFGPGSLPVRYDFSVTDTDGNPVSWVVTLDFSTSAGPVDVTFEGLTPDGGGTISGNPTVNVASSITVTNYSIDVSVFDDSFAENATLSLNVPAGQSVDVGGSSVTSSTPEPATLSLVGSAIAGLMFWRRKRA